MRASALGAIYNKAILSQILDLSVSMVTKDFCLNLTQCHRHFRVRISPHNCGIESDFNELACAESWSIGQRDFYSEKKKYLLFLLSDDDLSLK